MQSNSYRHRDYPLIWFTLSMLILAYGVYGYYWRENRTYLPYTIGISAVMLLFCKINTIYADRSTNQLTVSNWGLLRRKKTTLYFDEIKAIRTDSEIVESDDDEGNTSREWQYRIEALLFDGTAVTVRPLSSNSRKSRKISAALRGFIGVADDANTFDGTTNSVSTITQAHFQAEQELISGDQDEVHETDGVRWKIETTVFGGSPVTRWHSQDFNLPNQFLYLGQKIAGQKDSGRLARLLIDKTIAFSFSIYGFKTALTPDEDNAELLEVGNGLEPHFIAFGNNNNLSATLLNSHTTFALRKWAEQHPLKKLVEKGGYNQLVILYCPQGLYLATLETLSQQRINELASLGVALVQAQ